jgi:hypothetical protein
MKIEDEYCADDIVFNYRSKAEKKANKVKKLRKKFKNKKDGT